jgi:Adenylate and Guanylate cyclase catalytic domain
LSAIYSRLAEADEEGTLARLRALRGDLIDPAIAAHRGRIVKRTGDGSLIEFRSVVDAVRCAVEVQNRMVERNAGMPENRRIEFRVGIHSGDVVEKADGDLMGDGVNIAARLEEIAKPGAICLSEDAYRQLLARLLPTKRYLIVQRPEGQGRQAPSARPGRRHRGQWPVETRPLGAVLKRQKNGCDRFNATLAACIAHIPFTDLSLRSLYLLARPRTPETVRNKVLSKAATGPMKHGV